MKRMPQLACSPIGFPTCTHLPSPRRLGSCAVLDPSHPAIPLQDEYANFPSYIYLVGSGCYQLSASWEGGGWVLEFAFGT